MNSCDDYSLFLFLEKTIMINISKKELEKLLDYNNLIAGLEKAFQEDYQVPPRHHHNYANPKEAKESTLLLMPAWQTGKYLGVKLITVSPENGKYNLPSIHGTYTLFDAHQGMPLAQLDARALTNLRTAATSALASSFLSKKNSTRLLIVGTGALAPELIKAHIAVRPIQEVFVWGRNFEKAKTVCKQFTDFSFDISPIKKIENGIKKADIISCATLSNQPLIHGTFLQAGQHLDLVGAFKPNMRETDDLAVQRSSIFVDTNDGLHESGDIFQPLESGLLKREEIKANLFELCRHEKHGRTSEEEITFFKSVGHALEDLAAAKLAYEKYK